MYFLHEVFETRKLVAEDNRLELDSRRILGLGRHIFYVYDKSTAILTFGDEMHEVSQFLAHSFQSIQRSRLLERYGAYLLDGGEMGFHQRDAMLRLSTCLCSNFFSSSWSCLSASIS